MTTNQPEIAPKSAADFLAKALSLLDERGQQYDTGNERSGPKIAAAFNAITGKDLTAAEVYLVLQITKDVRQWSAPEYHPDSAEDCISYAALKAEELASVSDKPWPTTFPNSDKERKSFFDEKENERRKSDRRVANGNARVFGVNRRSGVATGRRAVDQHVMTYEGSVSTNEANL